nr:cysteine proteinase 3-like [Ipomoea batatas]GME08098.1 cysteine proteinase 3-like [Ipomoea batatas]
MAGDSFLSKPPVFTGENYHAWFVKMETYLEAHGLWEMMEIYEVPALPEDPTISQMREYREEKKKMNKAKTCIHSALTDEVFTKIMTCKTGKQAWVLLKNEYEGNDRTKRMQVLNLKREFEMQKMKETKSLKDYSERLKKVVNKIRLLGEELPDDRVVEKILLRFKHLKACLALKEDNATVKPFSFFRVGKLMAGLELMAAGKLIAAMKLRAAVIPFDSSPRGEIANAELEVKLPRREIEVNLEVEEGTTMARLSVFVFVISVAIASITGSNDFFANDNPIRKVVSDGLHELESSILQVIDSTRHASCFAHKYGKRYDSAEEINQRFGVFKDSLKMIRSHNKKGLPYKLGVNEFADMTWNEFQNTTGALEAAYAQVFRKNISLSEQQLVDCAGAFNNFGCNGGLPSQAFEYIKYNGGLDTEEAYPYTGENGVCNYSFENVGVRVFESVNITLGAEDELKYAVGLIRLVSVAFEVVDGFKLYESGVYTSNSYGSDPMDVNHDILAVGYGV